ncbi:unnamed protein product [Ectocarpus sp. CCAP 1310/34]|nr:unnamed protein product [Ectocarpus sp. CCAP 1310/34]
MTYEALIVVVFGVALAVASVALFIAHVKRINAPNRADPAGTLVHVDLGAALAKDEAAAALREAGGRNNGGRRSTNEDSSAGCSGDAFALQPNGAARRRRRPSVETANRCAHGSQQETAAAVGTQQPTDTQQPREAGASSYTATMVLPSPLWAEAILKHAEVKRKKLRSMVKSGEIAAGWEAKWERLPRPRRRKLLEAVREELVHAVSSYIGRDEALFDVICPHLSLSALEEEHRGISGLSRLVRGCMDGKLPEPRSKAFVAVRDALAMAATGAAAAAAAENVSKDKRGPVRAFLPTFRKLCSSSFCIGALEAIVSGRADGSAGPTVGSVCSALVKTGGSGVLLFAFFHGLKQMSASEVTDSAGLPAGVGGGGGSRIPGQGTLV